jgi:hypothetical protein
MRHLGSLVAALLITPAVWVLTGVGLSGYARARTGTDAEARAALLLGVVALLAAAALYAVLVVPRLSPVGPAVAGLALLGVTAWSAVDVAAVYRAMPRTAFGVEVGLARPAEGVAVLLAVPLLATLLSPARWRRRAAVAGPAYVPPGPVPGPGPMSGAPVIHIPPEQSTVYPSQAQPPGHPAPVQAWSAPGQPGAYAPAGQPSAWAAPPGQPVAHPPSGQPGGYGHPAQPSAVAPLAPVLPGPPSPVAPAVPSSPAVPGAAFGSPSVAVSAPPFGAPSPGAVASAPPFAAVAPESPAGGDVDAPETTTLPVVGPSAAGGGADAPPTTRLPAPGEEPTVTVSGPDADATVGQQALDTASLRGQPPPRDAYPHPGHAKPTPAPVDPLDRTERM